MSSPPTPTTSIKAAILHTPVHKHQRRPSLPSVAALNPFRKRATPNIETSQSPVEPYEVAPGIWNTDATAKVFGYLEPNEKKTKSRGGKSAGSGTRNRSQIPKRKPVAFGDSQISTEKTTNDAKANSLNSNTAKTYVELPGFPVENQKSEINRILQQSREKAGKGRMRTVSKDDQLVQRGANPRTGLVSPFVVSDSSDDNLSRDYVNVDKARLHDRPLPKTRTRSGKWKQQGAGWSLVESPLLSPIAQSIADPLSRKVSVQKLEDNLLVQMPGVDNPEPNNMTDEQIRIYQEGVARAYKHGGSGAMIDPYTLPSPRPSTPDGPSTPPNRLQRIRRKMVGSGLSRKEESSDTIVVGAQQRASSAPATRKDNLEVRNVRDEIANSTVKAASLENGSEDKTAFTGDPFLGQLQRQQPSQMASVTQTPSSLPVLQQEAHSGARKEPASRVGKECIDPQASPTLSQYLPRLKLLHPSHFANLGTSSYRRPAHLLPERLRPPEQQRQTIEDACITTITSTSNRKQQSEQKPKMRGRDESIVFPQMKQCPAPKFEMSRESYLQAGTLRKRPSFATKPTADVSSSNTTRQDATRVLGQTTPPQKLAVAQSQSGVLPSTIQLSNKTSNQEAERGARVAMIENHRSQQLPQTQLRKKSSTIPVNQDLSLGSANIVRDPVRRDQRNGAGTIPTCGHLGDDCRENAYKVQGHKRGADLSHGSEKDFRMPAEMAFKHDGGAWFSGEWARNPENHDGVVSVSKEALPRRTSILGRAAEARLSYNAFEGLLKFPIPLQYVQLRLYEMACHVMQTLHSSSPALTVLRSPNVSAREFLFAIREVFLAVVYLLLLLNIIMVLRKVIVLVSVCLFWIWHPVRMAIAVFRWCVLA